MKIKLLARQELAYETMGFVFGKPTGFEFKAGQSGDFTLLNPPETDAEGNTRAFSLCNPPYAKDLMIATRMRDTAFKRVLRSMPLGTELEFAGPFGSFTLHNKASRPAVFLTGGIGITPVRSMVLQAAKEKLAHKIFLFYGNKSPQEIAFFNELQDLERENRNYTFIPTIDKADSQGLWKGNIGFINETLVKKHVSLSENPIFYMCGPAPMVLAMRQLLNGIGVDDDDIRSEEFTGY